MCSASHVMDYSMGDALAIASYEGLVLSELHRESLQGEAVKQLIGDNYKINLDASFNDDGDEDDESEDE